MFVRSAIVLTVILLAVESSSAAIPRPDGIVYGKITMDGETIGQTEGYAVLARVDGFEAPTVVYRMGDLPAAGDAYLLHFPHRVQADGKTPDPGVPLAGAGAEIYVVKNSGTQVYAGRVQVPASGQVVLMDIQLSQEDVAAAQSLNTTSAGGCGTGALCGTMGMITQVWIAAGLMFMKLSANRRRRAG